MIIFEDSDSSLFSIYERRICQLCVLSEYLSKFFTIGPELEIIISSIRLTQHISHLLEG